jgi:hypothetical protein
MEDNKTKDDRCILAPLKFENTYDRREHYRRKTFKIVCANFSEEIKCYDHSDYAVFRPLDSSIIKNYEVLSTIYELPLSPSVVTLTY